MSAQFQNPAGNHRTPGQWSALALQAAAEVNGAFGHRLMGLPGTWIGAISAAPSSATNQPASTQQSASTSLAVGEATPWSEWHYWWQAHYLDAMVDAGFLALARGDRPGARTELQRARQLLRGIMIRNFGAFPNFYYDDMAWLALAAGRLNALSIRLVAQPSPLAKYAIRSLDRQLHSAHDDVLGGGLYWSRKRDFKNTPVNGPAALHFARTGQTDQARAVMDWLRAELFNPETGLYIDGVHPTPAGRSVEHTVYTYNQGTVLGALLELGDPHHLAQATQLVEAIRTQLSTLGSGLRLEPGGDGGLFTGILVRYLALAAHEVRLPAPTRATASYLIQETATQVGAQQPRQLSAAVQRWMILSAAATL